MAVEEKGVDSSEYVTTMQVVRVYRRLVGVGSQRKHMNSEAEVVRVDQAQPLPYEPARRSSLRRGVCALHTLLALLSWKPRRYTACPLCMMTRSVQRKGEGR